MNKQKLHDLRVFAAEIRLETLKIIGSRGFGHVGGSMSMADAMAVLYGDVMNIDPKNPRWEDRDWFVLSKGHGGPVMYATLGLKGYYPMESAYTRQPNASNFAPMPLPWLITSATAPSSWRLLLSTRHTKLSSL